MREAAAALALDPALAGAAELVGRLMLEPPRETPAEVAAAIEADDIRDARAVARAGVWAVFGSLAFAQLLWWIVPPGSLAPLWLSIVFAADGVVALYALRARHPVPGLILIANTVIVLLVARLFSPILIAPGVAASLAMAMVLTPRFSWLGSPWSIGAFMVGAVVLPLGLEQLGVVSRTMFVDAGGLRFHVPTIGAHEGPAVAVAALYAACLIAGACIAGYAMRSRTQAAHRHLHLQTWQLRQLVS
jgi:hypothetical protein